MSLSTDGEVRVLGLEFAEGLREQVPEPLAAKVLQRYLAPEVLVGMPAEPADDVYSLGAILFELITGARPPRSPEKWPAAIERARYTTDGRPLAAAAQTVLGRSIAPRLQRIPTVDHWRREIAGWIAAEEIHPTTFNLSFFLHTLLRDQIEGEVDEIEQEKAYEPPPAEPAAQTALSQRRASQRQRRWRMPTAAAAGALALVALAAYLYVTYGRDLLASRAEDPPALALAQPLQEPQQSAPPEIDPPAQLEAPGEPDPAASEPDPEAIEQLVRDLLEQRAAELEESLQAEYEARIAELQSQLETARRQESRPALQPQRPPTVAKSSEESLPEQRLVLENPTSPSRQQADPVGATTADTADTALTDDTAAGEAQSEPEPSSPDQIDETILIPEIVPARMVKPPRPQYPSLARKFGKEARVQLRILVGIGGQALKVEHVGPNAGFGFDESCRASGPLR